MRGVDDIKYTILKEKWKEALLSVLPVTVIVLLLSLTIAPLSVSVFLSFLFGFVFLVIGMGLFTLGAEVAMTPMGEYVGTHMTKSKKIWLIVLLSFLVGILITVSEPDLAVLSTYAPSIDATVLIWSVAVGVGAFLVLAMLRILFAIKLRVLLIISYAIVFTLAAFVNPDFWPIAFDAGGVTTGPMTVPFIMALGVGVSAVRSDKDNEADSFGLVALCSVGPIMAVLFLGLVLKPEGDFTEFVLSQATDSRELGLSFFEAIPHYMKEVAVALLPITGFFFVYQLFAGRLTGKQIYKILVGVGYTFVGLTLFLTGVNVGFMPAGYTLGGYLATSSFKILIIPIGVLIGYFIVAAEPAVQVLQKQVEEITAGAIPRRALGITLGIGVAISVGLAMIRVLTGISIFYFLVPGYLIALVLTFFVPEIFTSIAFDSGGVASGPMTATFLLPFAMGACTALGGNIVTDAFGVVAMVAMTPLIAIQLLGIVYQIKLRRSHRDIVEEESFEIIDFPEIRR